ncbi:MAG: type II toxin-antitoxin system YafQ family toxin [Clostridia bacterium]|nr:type II toxin-antitoxin system YafQ family toxin [Clostridia bacterium]
MLDIVASNQFKRDLRLARKRGFQIEVLRLVVNTLANKQTLDAKYRDHELLGQYSGFCECHVAPDWLLIYRIEDDALELFLFRTGTHSDTEP